MSLLPFHNKFLVSYGYYRILQIREGAEFWMYYSRDTLNKSAMMWHSKHKRPDTEWG